MRTRSRLAVDLGILADNYQKLKILCPRNETLFMVKADAYGHGLLSVVHFSFKQLGIKEFGCATLGEALRLREELEEDEFEVYVFSDNQLGLQSLAEAYLHHRIIPVLTSFLDLNFVLGHPDFKNFPICLKFNTGMNRLGFSPEHSGQVIDLLKKNGRRQVYHLMTHLSSASQSVETNERNHIQFANFEKIKEAFVSEGIELERTSIANSGAIEQRAGLSETHIRPGLMMYGPSALDAGLKSAWDGKVISRLETYVIDSFPVKKGTPISYGATPCPDDGVIAIVAIGYGDGFSTHYKGVPIIHKAKRGIVVGRVNMDMSYVLFPPGTDIRAGETFSIWGHEPSELATIAQHAGTIPYELFCQLTSRIPRVYGLE
jgi:alanine racemase